ncbi:MAG: glycosyltransferase family 2 protein [Prevotella sp.]|nr:glycosyltransferase family 2 protein [Prevotella sp.]
MKLSVIIVNYNVKHYLYQCLDSVYKALRNIEAEVFVVDNHSRDGSVEYLQRRYNDVNYIEMNHNLGFARANNIAIRQSTGDYVLLLNPDTIVGEQTLNKMVSFLDKHPEAGAAGVKMLNANGVKAKESRRGIPTPMTAFYKMTGLCNRFPKNKRLGKYYMGYLPWDEACEIEVVSGAFCMLRREALLKVGLLDEDFFMYGEDIDLSYRLLKGGFKNWYVPETILHYKGESTSKSSFRHVHVFYEAMYIFFKKHFGNSSLLISIPINFAIYLSATLALVKMQTRKMRKALGFFSHKRKKEPDYLFIGSVAAITQCRKLSRKKGLSSEFHVGNEKKQPEGHVALMEDREVKNTLIVVYDTDSYSYETILHIFAENTIENVQMGTYNPHTKTIITLEEVLK